MSADTIQLRPSRPEDAEAVIDFIRAMGFTPRDRVTWEALGMSAALALRGEEVVGAIPIEMRPVKIAPDLTVQWAHQTCVAVRPELRGGGLGTRLQKLLRSTLPSGTALMGVYREEPDSQAYRWYVKNGFRKAMTVVSWTMGVPKGRVLPGGAVRQDLQAAWQLDRSGGCFVDQSRRELSNWLAVHPYRSRYQFEVVAGEGGNGYAVLGVGRLHSESTRADVLDFVTGAADAPRLLHRCLCRASELGAEPLRWALSEHDPLTELARRRRMRPGWRFDVLIQPVAPGLHFDVSSWRYASIDFA